MTFWVLRLLEYEPAFCFNKGFDLTFLVRNILLNIDAIVNANKPWNAIKISFLPARKKKKAQSVELPKIQPPIVPPPSAVVTKSTAPKKQILYETAPPFANVKSGIKFRLKQDISIQNVLFKKGQVINALIPAYTIGVKVTKGGYPYATTADGSLPKNVNKEGYALEQFIEIPEMFLEKI